MEFLKVFEIFFNFLNHFVGKNEMAFVRKSKSSSGRQ
jgi:hypothetical protein